MFGIDVRTVSYLRRYYRYVSNFLRFGTVDEGWFLVFGVPSHILAKTISLEHYLAFGTPNTRNQPSSAVLNFKKFDTYLQYRLKYETVRTTMPNTIWLI